MQTITPPEIDAVVRAFCARINASSAPEYVPILPSLQASKGRCYTNVDTRIREQGGTKLHGWAVWLDVGFMIEAEHHAVWIDPRGTKIDVTPHWEQTLLFLPDPDRVFAAKPIANIRHGLLDHPEMPRYLALVNKVDELRIASANDDGSFNVTPMMMALFGESMQLRVEMALTPSG